MAAGEYRALIHYPPGEKKKMEVRAILYAPDVGGPLILVEDDRDGWLTKDWKRADGSLRGNPYTYEVWVERGPQR